MAFVLQAHGQKAHIRMMLKQPAKRGFYFAFRHAGAMHMDA